MYKSTNGGDSWTELSLGDSSYLQTMDITNLVIDPNDSDNLLVGSLSGLYKVTDGGSSWLKLDLSALGLEYIGTNAIYSKAAIRAMPDSEGVFYAAVKGNC